MVIVRLLGGLGNQLFQYAAARQVAVKRQVPLKLDVTAFDTYGRRDYCLNHFSITEEFASQDEIRRLRASPVRRLLARIVGSPRVGTHFEERHFNYDPRVLGICSGAYMSGYWQSEKYFSDIADLVRSEFRVATPATPENAAAQKLIDSTNSISIHVRRGDYVSNRWARRTHGVCPLDYYRLAVSEMLSHVQEPNFFVFSDDPDWTRDHLALPARATYVGHNGADRAYEDLRLMTACRHHIIANSTFSWWGAWLAVKPEKIVIAPKLWFAARNGRACDIYPVGWLTM